MNTTGTNEGDQLEVLVTLDYKTQSSLSSSNYSENQNYIAFTVSIKGLHAEDWIDLGEAEFSLIRLGDSSCDVSLFELFDTTQELTDLAGAVYNVKKGGFKKKVCKQFDDALIVNTDILHITHIALEPFARGQRLGQAVIKQIIRDFSSGCSLIAIDPYPLQLQKQGVNTSSKNWTYLHLDEFPKNPAGAIHRLQDHFAELGFELIENSPFMGICPVIIPSKLDALDLPSFISVPTSKFNAYPYQKPTS